MQASLIVILLNIFLSWNSTGYTGLANGSTVVVNTGLNITGEQFDVKEKTIALEREYESIEYCLSNMGKTFNTLDAGRIGSDKGFREFSSAITFGLVAVKFQDDYGDPVRAAKYFYMDWSEYKKCEKEWKNRTRKTACDTFGAGPGDYNPLGFAIGQWKSAGLYKEALQHYSEYFDETFLLLPENSPRKEKLRLFHETINDNLELRKKYLDFMRDWKEAKQLAKHNSHKSVDITMQNHEWFYSHKQSEVLKALSYYNKHKVRFMLEKALSHKDATVSKRAREYLGKLDKEAGK